VPVLEKLIGAMQSDPCAPGAFPVIPDDNEGKSEREAVRCLNVYLARSLFRML